MKMTTKNPVIRMCLVVLICCQAQQSAGMQCPPDCTCVGHVTVCVNYTQLPGSFPQGTQDLHFKAPRFSILEEAFRNYSTVEHLTVSNGYIAFLDDGAFAGAPALEFLQLENNFFKVIRAGVFRGLPRLQQLKLYNNNVDRIPADMFRDLQGLEWLEIEHSPSALQIREHSFRGLRNLRFLSLGNNELGILEDPGILEGLDALEELLVPSNQLTDIADGMFSGLSNLKLLDLSYNKLKFLKAELFHPGLHGLETLKLRYNPLNTVPAAALDQLPGLKLLDLQATGLHLIEPLAFSGVPRLQLLNLNDNFDMDTFPRLALGSLKHLCNLQLSNNQLATLPAKAFQNLTSLTYLFISHTQLRSVDEDAFSGLADLLLLELSFNKLRSLPGGVFAPLRALTDINLYSNPWSCDCNMKDFIDWGRVRFNGSSPQTGMHGLRCQSPHRLAGVDLLDVATENLTCTDSTLPPARTFSTTSHSLKMAIYICAGIGVTIALTLAGIVSMCLYRRLRKKISVNQQASYDRLRLPMRLWDDTEVPS